MLVNPDLWPLWPLYSRAQAPFQHSSQSLSRHKNICAADRGSSGTLFKCWPAHIWHLEGLAGGNPHLLVTFNTRFDLWDKSGLTVALCPTSVSHCDIAAVLVENYLFIISLYAQLHTHTHTHTHLKKGLTWLATLKGLSDCIYPVQYLVYSM